MNKRKPKLDPYLDHLVTEDGRKEVFYILYKQNLNSKLNKDEN